MQGASLSMQHALGLDQIAGTGRQGQTEHGPIHEPGRQVVTVGRSQCIKRATEAVH